MSRFQTARQNFREKVFGSSASATPSTSEARPSESSAEDVDVIKKERGLRQLLLHARRKYIEHGLEGSIEVYSLVTIFAHSISCDVSPGTADEIESVHSLDSEESPDTVEEAEQMSRAHASAVSAMDGVLRVLEKRARAYRNTSFKDDLTLSSGLYVTMPFIGLASISITFSASVKSLLAKSTSK